MAYGAEEQNLGWTREDDPAKVSRNRRNFLDRVAGEGCYSLQTIKQIHSGIVHDLERQEDGNALSTQPPSVVNTSGAATSGTLGTLAGDGMITAQSGQLLGILTADCVPVLLADRRTRAVAALHAGWRGTLARIVETGVSMLRSRHGSQPKDLVAAIGPSIRPCCFEVGPEVKAAFAEAFTYADDLFTPPQPSARGEKPHLDLQEANRRQLLASGLAADQIYTVAECTSCSRDHRGRRRFFSYRAEGGVTGRMLSVIGAFGG